MLGPEIHMSKSGISYNYIDEIGSASSIYKFKQHCDFKMDMTCTSKAFEGNCDDLH